MRKKPKTKYNTIDMKQIISISLFLLIIGCSSNSDKHSSNNSNKRESKPASTIRISREIAVTDSFFQITNISGGMIEFTQGPFSIISEGDSSSLSHYTYEFDGGILTISTPLERNNDYQTYPTSSNVVIHVSCPDLRAVAICSGGGFRSKSLLKGEEFQFGGMVGGEIDVDSIECQRFRYESNGSTSSHFPQIKCDECQIISSGNGTISLCVKSDKSTYLDISGQSTLTADISSPLTESIIETDGSVSFKLDTDNFRMRAIRGVIEMSGYALNQEIQQSRDVVIRNDLKIGK